MKFRFYYIENYKNKFYKDIISNNLEEALQKFDKFINEKYKTPIEIVYIEKLYYKDKILIHQEVKKE